jgi:hypothetical protein
VSPASQEESLISSAIQIPESENHKNGSSGAQISKGAKCCSASQAGNRQFIQIGTAADSCWF